MQRERLVLFILGWIVLNIFVSCDAHHEAQQLKLTKEQLQAKSISILQKECGACHERGSSFSSFQSISSIEEMEQLAFLVPGKPAESPLFTSITTGYMPPGSKLFSEDQKTLQLWIQSLAGENPNPSYDPTKNFGKFYVGVIEAYQCLKCHAQGAKTDLHSYKSTSNYIVPLAPEFSQLYVTLKTPNGADHTISKTDLDTIGQWILDGASFL
ncbi:MAG: hypothetical protein IPK68_14210 [Bdellovibrionales bacterium]|nr:hypothetical protein [Bdellovibrionales bacterium]